MRHKSISFDKSERALELIEKQIDVWAIAERLGIKPSQVSVYAYKARQRRAKRQQSEAAQ